MSNYTDWLEQMKETEEGNFNELLRFIESNSEWPKDSSNPMDYIIHINKSSESDDIKVKVSNDFSNTWEKWSKYDRKTPDTTIAETKLSK